MRMHVGIGNSWDRLQAPDVAYLAFESMHVGAEADIAIHGFFSLRPHARVAPPHARKSTRGFAGTAYKVALFYP